MIPYLILRVTAFDFASGLIPVNIEHWLDLGREAGLDSRGGALSLSVGWCHVRDAGGVRCGELSDGVMRRACDGES